MIKILHVQFPENKTENTLNLLRIKVQYALYGLVLGISIKTNYTQVLPLIAHKAQSKVKETLN